MKIRAISCLVLALLVAGCGTAQKVTAPPIPPPNFAAPKQTAPQFDYTHEYRPLPGYSSMMSAQADDLARRLHVSPYGSGPTGTLTSRTYYAPSTMHYRGRYRRDRSYPWLSTLFWTGAGAVIGHQSGHGWEGAGLGALFGHTLGRPGGMDPYQGGSIFTPNTLLLGGAGAVIGHQSGHAWEGAAIGGLSGRLIDHSRRRRYRLFGRDRFDPYYRSRYYPHYNYRR